MAFELRRPRRLRPHSQFVRAQRSGRRVSTPHFTLLVAARPRLPDDPVDCARLGLVVARKIGGAVRRNRVKRLCRECFRLWPDLLPRGVDLIVIAQPGAQDLRLSDLCAEWRSVQRQIGRRAAEALARATRPDHPPAAGF